MDKAELVEKFKLAAKLNGLNWEDVCDPWIQFQKWRGLSNKELFWWGLMGII